MTPRSGPRSSGGGPHTSDPGTSAGGRPTFRTAEEREAWEELNEFLGKNGTRGGSDRTRNDSTGSAQRPSQSLDRDYANLELPPGTDFSRVKASYKRLLRQYHPDRHSDNPEKQRIATEITQKLNASYQRIRDHVEGVSPH